MLIYCITHDRSIPLKLDEGQELSEIEGRMYCEAHTYDLEGATCSWQWEYRGRLLTEVAEKTRRRAKLIVAGSGKRK